MQKIGRKLEKKIEHVRTNTGDGWYGDTGADDMLEAELMASTQPGMIKKVIAAAPGTPLRRVPLKPVAVASADPASSGVCGDSGPCGRPINSPPGSAVPQVHKYSELEKRFKISQRFFKSGLMQPRKSCLELHIGPS